MAEHNCWHCGERSPGVRAATSLFCQFCNSLQAPSPDYYRFFGLPKKLDLDPAELQKTFYQFSRLLHPDRFMRRSPQEQTYSLEATAILNDGYRVLRDAVARAEYVLRENGMEVGEHRSKDVPPELLEQVFELNLALDELRHGDDGVIPQLEESRNDFVAMLADIDGELKAASHRHDDAADAGSQRAALEEIRAILHRRRYIRNLVNEVDRQLTSRNA